MEWVSGNIFIRPLGNGDLQIGEIVAGHVHNFDHTSLFLTGRWRARKWLPIVTADGEPTDEWQMIVDVERDAPFHLLIEAHAKHEFTFLGPPPGKAWCVYSHRTPQGEVVQHATGWLDAYY